MSGRQLVMFALLMGAVAAGVVWWLERYQAELLIAKFEQHLAEQAAGGGGETA